MRRRPALALAGGGGSAAPGRRGRRPRSRRASGRRVLVGLQGDEERSRAEKMVEVEASKSYGLQSWRKRTLPRQEWEPCSTWRGARASSTRRRRAGKTWVSRISFARITRLMIRAGKTKRRMIGREGVVEIVALTGRLVRSLRRRATSPPSTWSTLTTMAAL